MFLENNHNLSNVLCKDEFWNMGVSMTPQQSQPISFCNPQDVQAFQEVFSKLPLDKLETLVCIIIIIIIIVLFVTFSQQH